MNIKPNELDFWRSEAEAQLLGVPRIDADRRSAEALLQELQVHQIELEMQNEELRQTQQSLEEAMARYVDLYDFAPVGYLTLTGKTVIVAANLTGAEMLGIERNKLIRTKFASFVAPHDSDRLHLCLQDALQHDKKQNCNLELRRGDSSVFHVRLDCLQSKIDKVLSIRVSLSYADLKGMQQESTG